MDDSIYVLVHGFAGSIDEIEFLRNFLQDKGLRVYTVKLAGHGGTKKKLRGSSYTDWLRSGVDAVNRLKQQYCNIYLIGFSMGGLICASLSSIPEVKKIVFINTPIYFWNLRIIIRDIYCGIRNRKYDKISYYIDSVRAVSMKSGIDFLKLLSKSKKVFANINKPTLIVQCKDDESVNYKSAEYIKKKIGSKAQLQYYNGGCHQVFKNTTSLRENICSDILNFLQDDY